MTDVPVAGPASPSPPAAGGFNRSAAFRSIGLSLVVNALCPYLLYRYLAPKFPSESVLPLLYAAIFPVTAFLFELVRKRTVDAIALIVLFGLTFQITVTLLSPDISTALIVRSLEGAVIGTIFLVTVLAGRPFILYIARQFVAGGGDATRAGFDNAVELDKGRAFAIATGVWGAVIIVMSGVHVWLAAHLAHATFILVSPALGLVTNIVLLVWSIRYTTARLMRLFRPAA